MIGRVVHAKQSCDLNKNSHYFTWQIGNRREWEVQNIFFPSSVSFSACTEADATIYYEWITNEYTTSYILLISYGECAWSSKIKMDNHSRVMKVSPVTENFCIYFLNSVPNFHHFVYIKMQLSTNFLNLFFM